MVSPHPLVILGIGVAFVLVSIIWLRLNAFVALISAAMLVSLLAPGPIGERIERVAVAFGITAGKIGIVIAMAAIIGRFMMASGAADRIVYGFHRLLGPRRDAEALTASGFVLSIPVFFDTVFYLLVPLARSMYRKQGRNYLLFLLAIGAGGTVTHSLVPPTPGPVAAASFLQVDLGVAILVATFIGLPMAFVGLLFAIWANRRWPLEMRPIAGEIETLDTIHEENLPGLNASIAPVLLPVLLISGQTILKALAKEAPPSSLLHQLNQWAGVFGNASFALLLSAAIAVLVYIFSKQWRYGETTTMIEEALMSAGIIILITSAGGAFGEALTAAGIGDAIKRLFAEDGNATGMTFILMAFTISSLLKTCQGSSTVAMSTTAAILLAMLTPETHLGYHRVYLATAIGCGAITISWMNDSGFWVFSRMGGLTEAETLRTWTPLTGILGFTGMAITLLLALLLPMDSAPSTTTGRVERLEPAIDELVPADATIEVLASGFEWSEGPVWVKDGGFLLFSDVPTNTVYRWKEGEGLSKWLKPSGYTGNDPRGEEMGSNGLALDPQGRLVLCQHGDRRVARLDAPLNEPKSKFVTLVGEFEGKKFNSPNDLVFHSSGALYFTDPPYGLVKQWDDPARELGHCGVYRLDPSGKLELLTGKMTRPNGIGLSPDERTLYVAQSDGKEPIWMAFDLEREGGVSDERIFFDATELLKKADGLPDGLKVDRQGNVFATGPGGVLVFSPDGKHLGTISTGHKIANCAFGDDGKTLYMTSDAYLCRVKLSTTGLGF